MSRAGAHIPAAVNRNKAPHLLWLKAIIPPIRAKTAAIIGRDARRVEGIPINAPPAVIESDPNNMNTPCIIEVIEAPSVKAKIIQLIFIFQCSFLVLHDLLYYYYTKLFTFTLIISRSPYYPVPQSFVNSGIIFRPLNEYT